MPFDPRDGVDFGTMQSLTRAASRLQVPSFPATDRFDESWARITSTASTGGAVWQWDADEGIWDSGTSTVIPRAGGKQFNGTQFPKLIEANGIQTVITIGSWFRIWRTHDDALGQDQWLFNNGISGKSQTFARITASGVTGASGVEIAYSTNASDFIDKPGGKVFDDNEWPHLIHMNGETAVTGGNVVVFEAEDLDGSENQWIYDQITPTGGAGGDGDHKFLIESADPVAGYWDAKINGESGGGTPGCEAISITWVRNDGGIGADTVDMYCDFSTVNMYASGTAQILRHDTNGELLWVDV